MVCPTPPPGHTPVNLNVWFEAGPPYVAHLETQYGDLDLRGKGKDIAVCITIDQTKNPGLKFHADPTYGYGIKFADYYQDPKDYVYNNYKTNHQFGNSIASDGARLSFTYHNDETGGHDNHCSDYYAYSAVGFIVEDGTGVHESDPIIDNGSYTLRERCVVGVRHRR